MKFYYQVFELAQIIKPENGKNLKLEENFIINKQNVLYTKTIKPKTSQYIIAICADHTLPSAKTLSLNSNKVDNFDLFRGTLSISEQLQNQLSQKTQEIQSLQQEINYLKSSLEKIQSSKTYKIWQGYSKIMKKLGLKKIIN